MARVSVGLLMVGACAEGLDGDVKRLDVERVNGKTDRFRWK